MFNEDVEIFSIVTMDRVIQKAKEASKNNQKERDSIFIDDYTSGYINGLVDAFQTINQANEEYKGFKDADDRKSKWDSCYMKELKGQEDDG